MKTPNEHVRLQVPVSEGLAARIGELADIMRRSQRWMATELLNAVEEDRRSLDEYIAARILAVLRKTTDVIVGTNAVPEGKAGKVVHLDLCLNAKTAGFVHRLAERFGHTPAKMAGLMLFWGADENDFAIRLVAAPLMAAHRGVSELFAKFGGGETKRVA